MRKTAILTFDYELFLGTKTGTILNSLILPTRLILDSLQKDGAKAIFFVDATCLLFLRKYSPGDLQAISDQIREIVRQGSSVQLHLHPQWEDAVMKDGVIYFESFKNYNLLSYKPEEILDLFRASIDLLENITQQEITCYRAGGNCIEPFSHVKQAFETFNIKYDFSTAPGMVLNSGHIYDYDFRGIPDLMFYSFGNDLRKPEPNGIFYEFPVSTYKNNPFYRLLNLGRSLIGNDTIYGDGVGIQRELTVISRLISRRLGFSRTFLTLDQMDSRLFKHILAHHFRETPLIVILSHTKNFSEHSVLNLSYISGNYRTLNAEDLDSYILN